MNVIRYILFIFCILHFSCKSTYFSKKDVKSSQKLIGLEFSDAAIDTMYPYLIRNRIGYDSLRKRAIPNSVFPSLLFNPHPTGFNIPLGPDTLHVKFPLDILRPDSDHEMAFYSIIELASLIRTNQLTSVELTSIYLDRLKKYNATLKCAITITEELAMVQAKRADDELRRGIDRGMLHGIPYGTKDLMSVAGYKTTWGARPFENQRLEETAAVIQHLEEAGAVLIAKLSSGALARGDIWFGGQTVSPWDTLMGASGSSAGSGSATAAGLVGFSLGTETLGSITSPSNRNGVTGHRPTYGRVSRDGVMSLSWSMDKVGPICRSALDCALVFDVLEDNDPLDRLTEEASFVFDEELDIKQLKIAYIKELVDLDTTVSGDNIRNSLKVLRAQGVEPDSVSLPDDFPYEAFDIILRAESGAFFDELVRSGGVDKMVEQNQRSRANSLRQSRFIPAVEYIQANRFRTMLIESVHNIFMEYDVIITPTFAGRQLLITNLTGHPVIVVPNGFDKENHPTSISFLGNLYEDDLILSFAHYFQKITDHHKSHPPLFKL